MNPLLINTILASNSGDREDTVWMQILVIVILAASFGVYTFIKNRPDSIKDRGSDLEDDGSDYPQSSRWSHRPHKNIARRRGDLHQKYPAEIKAVSIHSEKESKSDLVSFSKTSQSYKAGRKKRDINSGMELLDLDLLLSIVHNTKSDDKNDVVMRKLAFNELLRRQHQDQIYSTALSVYAVDKSKLYGKDIQCEAIKELTQRTAHSS